MALQGEISSQPSNATIENHDERSSYRRARGCRLPSQPGTDMVDGRYLGSLRFCVCAPGMDADAWREVFLTVSKCSPAPSWFNAVRLSDTTRPFSGAISVGVARQCRL